MLKILVYIDNQKNSDIIGIKEDIAAYCEKFSDVAFVDVKKVQQKPEKYIQERMY